MEPNKKIALVKQSLISSRFPLVFLRVSQEEDRGDDFFALHRDFCETPGL